VLALRWVTAFSDLETGSSSSRLSMEPVEEGPCYFPRINGVFKLQYKAKDPNSAPNENCWIHVFSVENCIVIRVGESATRDHAHHADLIEKDRERIILFLPQPDFYLILLRSLASLIITNFI